jgi:predicted nucleotidyltransferase component of viral defense system
MEDVDELRNSGERKLAKDMYDVVHALDGIVNETGVKARSLQGITERDCRRFL